MITNLLTRDSIPDGRDRNIYSVEQSQAVAQLASAILFRALQDLRDSKPSVRQEARDFLLHDFWGPGARLWRSALPGLDRATVTARVHELMQPYASLRLTKPIRQTAIAEYARTHRGESLDPKSLAGHFGVDVKTIYQDLQELRGAPLKTKGSTVDAADPDAMPPSEGDECNPTMP